MYVFIDFETRSEADITKVGGWLYSCHPTTEVLCCVISLADVAGNDITVLIKSNDLTHAHKCIGGAAFLRSCVMDKNTIFVAHNAFFEQAVWQNIMVERHGFPSIPVERWRCTRALAWAHGLPGNLDGATKALKLPQQKQADGKRLIKLLCQPQTNKRGARPADGKFWRQHEKPEEFQKLYDYCIDDVLATRALFNRLRPLTPYEQQIWEVDQRINQRGIQLDVPLLERANAFIEYHKYQNAIEFQKLTGIDRASLRAQFQNWVNIAHGAYWDEFVEFDENGENPQTVERLVPTVGQSVWIDNTQAGTIKQLIANPQTLPEVKTVAELYQQAQKTSLIKYEKALTMADEYGIYREVGNYYGAHTGRWTSWGAQWQNPPRPKHKIEAVIKDIHTNSYRDFEFLYGSVTMPLSSMIRGLVIARPGKKLYVGDYVQIEARGLSYLAGDEAKLDLYRQGMDVYSQGASELFGVTVDKHNNGDKRQAYKVLELANQYGGGIRAGERFAKAYDFDPEPLFDMFWSTASEDMKRKAEWSLKNYKGNVDPVDWLSDKAALAVDLFKQRWRQANPKIVRYWEYLEDAVKAAIHTHKPVVVGAVTWFVNDIFLYCRLPSGRDIVYPYPDVSSDGSISYWGDDNGKFVKQYTYGGKLSENVTQAFCRDFLAWALVDLEMNGFPPILHLHDEAICEVDENDDRFEQFKRVLGQPRKWAPGFPIDTDCWTGVRYDKR